VKVQHSTNQLHALMHKSRQVSTLASMKSHVLDPSVTFFMQSTSANEATCHFECIRRVPYLYMSICKHPSAEIIEFTGVNTQALYSSALNDRSDIFTNTLYIPRRFTELALIAFH
jgi:hypothetical protein